MGRSSRAQIGPVAAARCGPGLTAAKTRAREERKRPGREGKDQAGKTRILGVHGTHRTHDTGPKGKGKAKERDLKGAT